MLVSLAPAALQKTTKQVSRQQGEGQWYPFSPSDNLSAEYHHQAWMRKMEKDSKGEEENVGERDILLAATGKKISITDHMKRTFILNVISEELTRINPCAVPCISA